MVVVVGVPKAAISAFKRSLYCGGTAVAPDMMPANCTISEKAPSDDGDTQAKPAAKKAAAKKAKAEADETDADA